MQIIPCCLNLIVQSSVAAKGRALLPLSACALPYSVLIPHYPTTSCSLVRCSKVCTQNPSCSFRYFLACIPLQHTHAHTHAQTHMHMHKYSHTYTRMHTHSHKYTCMHTHTFTHTRMHAHTHIHALHHHIYTGV